MDEDEDIGEEGEGAEERKMERESICMEVQ